ncbi:CDP-alcohol phosphatidyltransferase family protein [Flavobacterium sp.]|uniref:CDP-alcohol phosphatidyltransferase family protein n=1 Tax=Flavobacterium sp. TaxID=239 RepID=UPI0039E33D57
MTEKPDSRRPIETRNAGWAKRTASWLAKHNVTPNAISVFSIVFSALSFYGFYWNMEISSGDSEGIRSPLRFVTMAVVIIGIQGRLIMNLLDGMVAVEHNRKSAVGGLFNEVPDRISDTLTLLGLSYMVLDCSHGKDWVWLAVFLSVCTAYIRTLGASLGVGHFFIGPMAKQHRMALVCAGCVIYTFYESIFYYLLLLMNIGLVITCYRRLSKIVTALKSANP